MCLLFDQLNSIVLAITQSSSTRVSIPTAVASIHILSQKNLAIVAYLPFQMKYPEAMSFSCMPRYRQQAEAKRVSLRELATLLRCAVVLFVFRI